MDFMHGPLWTDAHRALWQRIAAHPFESPDIPADFTQRLAHDKSWSLNHTRRAIEEYRRFCFLSAATGIAVTPSEEVDEVWHKHLTYSRDYWDVWCPTVLGRTLHHEPTAGGAAEDRKYREQYAVTLATYEEWFGASPEEFWPSTRKRFAPRPRFRSVDTDRFIAIPRPRFPTRWALGFLAVGLCPAIAMAQTGNPLDWSGESFMALYIGIMVVAIALLAFGRRMVRDTGPLKAGLDPDTIQVAYLAGGPNRAFTTAMLQASRRGDVTVDDDGSISIKPVNQIEPALAACLTNGMKYAAALRAVQPWLASIRLALEDRGFLLKSGRRLQYRLLPLVLLSPVLAIGAMKLQIGFERGRPIGFLLFSVILTGILMIVSFRVRPFRSRQADALITMMRLRSPRPLRAPTENELALALALGGTGVLIGTSYAALGATSRRVGGDSTSGCGSDSGSSSSSCGSSGGDSGGGSSGCGGCSSSSC